MMNVLIFGATGMVGQGVLRECLLDGGVKRVLTIGRSATGAQHSKLKEIVHKDFFHYESIESELTGFDACFFCLGVSSVGMEKAEYERLTYDLTTAAAQALCRLNPQMTFIYVSGDGTDSSESGTLHWARIKGKTENAIMKMPFQASYMFRPGFIEPLHGAEPKATLSRVAYKILRPIFPLLRWAFPTRVLDTELIGRAMLNAVRNGSPKRILAPPDIRSLGV
jgi:uncharacterized protein YbjT (DUF2867 family)